jgi:hypothetical protein
MQDEVTRFRPLSRHVTPLAFPAADLTRKQTPLTGLPLRFAGM